MRIGMSCADPENFLRGGVGGGGGGGVKFPVGV